MSLPATWLALPDVGTAGNQGPDPAACADPQVRGLLRCRQFGQRPVRPHDVPDLQRRDIPRASSSGCCASKPRDGACSSCSTMPATITRNSWPPYLRCHARDLRLLFLPPYSPQLAPIERVWKLTRRLATHNRYFATLPEVLKAVNACFDRWRRPNDVLRRLCCIT